MQYKALVSFSGIVSMAAGEVRDITDPLVAKDLLQAGYIEQLKDAPKRTPKTGVKNNARTK